MNIRITWKWAIFASVIVMLLGFSANHFLQEIVVQYPLDTWRMDLDDFLANIGLFLGGLGALSAVLVRLRKTEDKITQVEHHMNGGMTDLAEKILLEQLEIAGYGASWLEVVARLDKIESERDSCREQVVALTRYVNNAMGTNIDPFGVTPWADSEEVEEGKTQA